MSYTRLLYHIVFRTHESKPAINEEHETDLYRYVWGIVQNKRGHLYRINSMPDHVHMLVELPADIAVAAFVKSVKLATSAFLKTQKDGFPTFHGWARGYCALSYSINERDKIINYIKGQKEHHRRTGLSEELRALLDEAGIRYEEQYLMTD